MVDLALLRSWRAPADWHRIHTIDLHTGGEPIRVIVGGIPEVPGATILERRALVMKAFDHYRKALLREPRGHRDMYGCILTPPAKPESAFGVIFMHNEGYSTMCGHGIIAVSRLAVDAGIVPSTPPETHLVIDTPAGTVESWVHSERGVVRNVRFRNIPSFVDALDETVDVPGIGPVRYDLAFGGAYYAFVDASRLGLTCAPREAQELIEKGMAIKRAVMKTRAIGHPFQSELGFLYGTIFVAPPQSPTAHSRNVCVFADGQIDRSPTGTGVSGRLAIHFQRGEIGLNTPIVIESIIGSTFTCTVVGRERYGTFDAVIPEVEGSARIIGRHEFLIDPNDPFGHGFELSGHSESA